MSRSAALLVTLTLLLAGSAAAAQETPRAGGVLKVATVGEPPTLDIPMSTATLAYEIMSHVNETLFTYDAGFNPVPLLADAHAVSEGGRRHTVDVELQVVDWATLNSRALKPELADVPCSPS